MKGELSYFLFYAELLNESKTRNNMWVDSAANEFRKILKKFQIAEFPLLRKKFQEIAAKLVFEYNIDVKTSIMPHTMIAFIHDDFSDNKQVTTFMYSQIEIISAWRYKETQFRTSYNDYMVLYKLNTINDDSITSVFELAELNPKRIKY